MRCIYVAGREGALFFRLYTLLSPIIPDQSQKNVGEKSVDNNSETWLRFGAFVCCAGTGPRSGGNANNERCPHFSFELICSVTHRRTKATYFLCSLVRTHCDIIPSRLSGYACANINRVDFEVAKYSKSGFENVNRVVPPRRRPGQIANGLTTWDFCPATPSDQIRSASYFYWPP